MSSDTTDRLQGETRHLLAIFQPASWAQALLHNTPHKACVHVFCFNFFFPKNSSNYLFVLLIGNYIPIESWLFFSPPYVPDRCSQMAYFIFGKGKAKGKYFFMRLSYLLFVDFSKHWIVSNAREVLCLGEVHFSIVF